MARFGQAAAKASGSEAGAGASRTANVSSDAGGRHTDARRGARHMLAIIISACLVHEPNVCKDYKVPLMFDVSSEMCMLHAPPHFAKWAEDHPGWQIKRWRCSAASDQDL
jgi:hypothetical protein